MRMASVLAPISSTPCFFRMSTTTAEKPHCGNILFPFMKRMTRLLAIRVAMNFSTSAVMAFRGIKVRRGLDSSGAEVAGDWIERDRGSSRKLT